MAAAATSSESSGTCFRKQAAWLHCSGMHGCCHGFVQEACSLGRICQGAALATRGPKMCHSFCAAQGTAGFSGAFASCSDCCGSLALDSGVVDLGRPRQAAEV